MEVCPYMLTVDEGRWSRDEGSCYNQSADDIATGIAGEYKCIDVSGILGDLVVAEDGAVLLADKDDLVEARGRSERLLERA
jgi:hypothetical protein